MEKPMSTQMALVKYGNALLLWNEAVKNHKTDTGVKKKTAITHKAYRKAAAALQDAILKNSGKKRYFGRADD